MFAELSDKCGVTTFFTDREGGVSKGGYASFNLGLFSGDTRVDVERNRALLCEALHIPLRNLVVPNEVHGNRVMALTEESLLIPEEERDGLTTVTKMDVFYAFMNWNADFTVEFSEAVDMDSVGLAGSYSGRAFAFEFGAFKYNIEDSNAERRERNTMMRSRKLVTCKRRMTSLGVRATASERICTIMLLDIDN